MTVLPPVATALLALLFYGACWLLLSLWRLGPAGDRGAALALFSLGIGSSALLALACVRWIAPAVPRWWRKACVVVAALTCVGLALPHAEALRAPLLVALFLGVASVAVAAWRHQDGRAAAVWAIVAGTELATVVSRYGCTFQLLEEIAGPWAGGTVCGALLGPGAAETMAGTVVVSGLGLAAWMFASRP